MRVWLIASVFIILAVASARPDTWYTTVEEAVAKLAIGPLRADFRPSNLAARSREHALDSQTNAFRAKVVQYMLESLGTIVRVCPYDNTSKEAVNRVVNELRNRTFTAQWLPTDGACGHHKGALHVIVPPPSPSERGAPTGPTSPGTPTE